MKIYLEFKFQQTRLFKQGANMTNLLKLSTAVLALGFLVGCGGGGSKSPVSEKTQAEKANLLVRGLNTYTTTETTYEQFYVSGYYDYYGNYVSGHYEYDWVTRTVEKQSTQYGVAKLDSLVKGTAVLVDTYTNRFFAISLNDYYKISADSFSYTNTGANAYKDNQTSLGLAYYNLRANGDTTYSFILPDGSEGIRFHVTEINANEVDMLAYEGMKYESTVAVVKSNLERLKMSSAKSEEAARLLVSAQNISGGVGNVPLATLSGITEKVIGSSVDQISAAVSGNTSAQATVLANAVQSGAIESAQDGIDLATSVINSLGQ
jgi:hypothetical protein